MLAVLLRLRKLRDEGSDGNLFRDAGRRVRGYPWGELVGPLPRPAPRDGGGLAVGRMTPRDWGWETAFLVDLLSWLNRLQWSEGKGHVTFIELALDFEATAERAIPPSPQAALTGGTLSLQERARVLRLALAVMQRNSQGGPLLPAKVIPRATSLVPMGGAAQAGLDR